MAIASIIKLIVLSFLFIVDTQSNRNLFPIVFIIFVCLFQIKTGFNCWYKIYTLQMYN